MSPDQAGLTWFLAGTAFCLEDDRNADPKPNSQFEQFRDVFLARDFDHPLLESNYLTDIRFCTFQVAREGSLGQKRTTIQTADYAGGSLDLLIRDPDAAWDALKDVWDRHQLQSVDEIEATPLSRDKVLSLLSVLVHEADLLGFVLPMDEFALAQGMTDADLPEYLSRAELETRQGARLISQIDPQGTGYLQIYADLYEANNSFFLGTMSDVFLETFGDADSGASDPTDSWDSFREYVWRQVRRTEWFEPGRYDGTLDHRDLFPVYFEPDRADPRTERGMFKPKLDWDDDHYSLRGLQPVLERMVE
ncbi:hypothetical protein [Haloplanus salilacus]|uniref:hypothetical protein n=1 Tax=Haloplanus salilacus TaxID=2949994 RepID=UPI0030D374BE